jgi:hypothetical protein
MFMYCSIGYKCVSVTRTGVSLVDCSVGPKWPLSRPLGGGGLVLISLEGRIPCESQTKEKKEPSSSLPRYLVAE